MGLVAYIPVKVDVGSSCNVMECKADVDLDGSQKLAAAPSRDGSVEPQDEVSAAVSDGAPAGVIDAASPGGALSPRGHRQ